MSAPSTQRGFGMIELMVTVAILVILGTLAAPSFMTFLGNFQVRSAAETILSGLQVARAEAVRRNESVSFTLGSGTTWTVFPTSDNTNILKRYAGEASSNVSRTVKTTAGASSSATTVTFNGLGRVTNTTAYIQRLDIAHASASAARQIRVELGGAIRMCDPSQSSGDPRAC